MTRTGRRTKLTPQVRDRLVEALRKGYYLETAAELAGVGRRTVYTWLERGRAALAHSAQSRGSEAIYADFAEAVATANAAAEADAIDVIRRDQDWRATAFFLERRFPDRWRRRDSHELTGADGGAIATDAQNDVDLRRLSGDELAQLQRLLEKGREEC